MLRQPRKPKLIHQPLFLQKNKNLISQNTNGNPAHFKRARLPHFVCLNNDLIKNIHTSWVD